MNCGTFFVVNEDTKFCINCGNLLLDYELKKVKKCPKCGQKNPEVANVCRHCGYKFPEASKKGKTMQPIIKDLKAKENSYTIGSFINIMWDVANATHISLNGLNLTNHDSYEYEVKGDETLELVATNDYAQTTKSIKLSPIPLPKIVKFTPSRQKVKAGEKIEIRVHPKIRKQSQWQSQLQ